MKTPDDEGGSRLVHKPTCCWNGGHGSSLEYQHGAFLRSLKFKSQWIYGRLLLLSVILFISLYEIVYRGGAGFFIEANFYRQTDKYRKACVSNKHHPWGFTMT